MSGAQNGLVIHPFKLGGSTEKKLPGTEPPCIAYSGTYAVLGRRRARVVREELREGSGTFSVLAHMPAQASFGLADDLRARTSGGASAALMLSHWERLQVCIWQV